jgi:hypothetical protein
VTTGLSTGETLTLDSRLGATLQVRVAVANYTQCAAFHADTPRTANGMQGIVSDSDSHFMTSAGIVIRSYAGRTYVSKLAKSKWIDERMRLDF